MNDNDVKQRQVQQFWNEKPCDSDISNKSKTTKEYYLEIERDRYKYQNHINDVLDKINWKSKKVLEIGTGVGTDARNIINRGGSYTGINVDKGSVEITRIALDIFGLPGRVFQSSATDIALDDNCIDVVYSFGVLHHIPDVNKAIAEILRVLKPGGEILIMLYNRDSINYKIEILILRKLLLRILKVPGVINLFSALGLPREKMKRHVEIFNEYGRLTNQEWLNRNTDGPDNPYSLVYNEREAFELLSGFSVIDNSVLFFDYRHWGILGKLLPKFIVDYLGKRWGWHRIIYAKKLHL